MVNLFSFLNMLFRSRILPSFSSMGLRGKAERDSDRTTPDHQGRQEESVSLPIDMVSLFTFS